MDRTVDFVRNECKEHVSTSNNQLTAELLNLFESQLRSDDDPKVRIDETYDLTIPPNGLHSLVLSIYLTVSLSLSLFLSLFLSLSLTLSFSVSLSLSLSPCLSLFLASSPPPSPALPLYLPQSLSLHIYVYLSVRFYRYCLCLSVSLTVCLSLSAPVSVPFSLFLIPFPIPYQTLAQDTEAMNALLVWCFAWSFGANIVDSCREKFSDYCRRAFSQLVASRYAPLLQDLYGTYVDLSSSQSYRSVKSWSHLMSDFKYDPKTPFFGILVPTVDTTRYRYLLKSLMSAGHNVLFMAETGVGKSSVVSAFLNDTVAAGHTVSYTMGYSAQSKPSNLRDILEAKLEKKRKNLLGPPSGKKMFLFIDDLNMPSLETFGAQPPNELLRQIIDQVGFYDVTKLYFKAVQDVVCVAACAPPGGGRNEVSPRLLRHFHMVWLTNLSGPSMCRIFTSILKVRTLWCTSQ